ncbi:hypothetical protein CUP1588 [Campylobacter upsaliensis RM3195]|nr:hypothetical protein CUP1588 [Campylobacter upsaliensis RM3195]
MPMSMLIPAFCIHLLCFLAHFSINHFGLYRV